MNGFRGGGCRLGKQMGQQVGSMGRMERVSPAVVFPRGTECHTVGDCCPLMVTGAQLHFVLSRPGCKTFTT